MAREIVKSEGRLYYRQIVDAVAQHSAALSSLNAADLIQEAAAALERHIGAVGKTENRSMQLDPLTEKDFTQFRSYLADSGGHS
jgi:hypothetical protein